MRLGSRQPRRASKGRGVGKAAVNDALRTDRKLPFIHEPGYQSPKEAQGKYPTR
jgi:hypothetical protein